ncbi:MAG: hypothetical protein ABIJ09_10470 [Pseudomonadota bacterium]
MTVISSKNQGAGGVQPKVQAGLERTTGQAPQTTPSTTPQVAPTTLPQTGITAGRESDGFDGRAERVSLSPRGEEVLRTFMTEVETGTQMTARDLFDPTVERLDGHPLSKKISDDEMKRLVSRLARDMPLCDLPGGDLVARTVSQLPGAQNLQGDPSRMSYRELSRALGDSAKDQLDATFKPLLDDFRDNHKAAFYSMATLGAVGVGALAYTQGSDLLRKLGVKPKLRQKFFDDRLRATVEANWGKKFSSIDGTVSLETRSRDDRLSLMASVTGGSDGLKEATVRGRAIIEDAPLGLDQLALHGAYTHDFVNNHDLSSLGIAGSKGALTFTASDVRNWTTGASRTELDVGTEMWGGRLSGYAANIRDGNREDNQVGVLYRVQF